MTQPEPEDVAPADRSQVLCSAWASPADVPEHRRSLLSDEEWAIVLMQASEILWMLSGRRFYGAGCTESATLRSTPPGAGEGAWPYHTSWGNCDCWDYGYWANGVLMPPSNYGQEHYSPMAIRLPRSPVTVTSVTVNEVAFTEWRVTRAGYLERTDGGSWNVCGDSTTVAYTFGEPPPETGVQAAVELAIQFALSRNNSQECELPARVQSVTRQGISVNVLDPQEFLSDGRTGLYMVDLFLAAINPLKRAQRARVWSPDIPTAGRN